MAVVRVQKKLQATVRARLRRRAGLADGDRSDSSPKRGKIVLAPPLQIDRSKFPPADDEYTPEQRRIIDARLTESAEDVKQGRTFGPFESSGAAIKFLDKEIKARKRNEHKKPQK